jgi:hypothetical protein
VAWATAFAVAVTVAGLFGLWFQATLPSRLPTATDWRAAASLLAREARPGDAVVLSPWWAERARQELPDRLPARPDTALPVLSLPSYAEGVEDLAGIRRVWLLALPGAPGADARIAGELAARSASVEPTVTLGRIALTRHDLRSPVLPLLSFVDRLPSATVEGAPARFAREVREVDGLPRACIVAAFAGSSPAPATLRFRDVPLGRALRGHLGLVGDVAAGASAVSVRVRVDGVDLTRAEARPGGAPWAPFQADTARLRSPAREVEVVISPSGPLPRGACLDLVVLP